MKSRITSPQNAKSLFISTQASSSGAFVINKAHIVAQRPRKDSSTQNLSMWYIAKVPFFSLSSSIKLFTALPGCCLLQRMPFSNFVRKCTCSLVPRTKTIVIGLGARQVQPHSQAPPLWIVNIEVVQAERAWYVFSREQCQKQRGGRETLSVRGRTEDLDQGKGDRQQATYYTYLAIRDEYHTQRALNKWLVEQVILGQKQSRSSHMARRVLHPIFGCPYMHLLSQLTLNFSIKENTMVGRTAGRVTYDEIVCREY